MSRAKGERTSSRPGSASSASAKHNHCLLASSCEQLPRSPAGPADIGSPAASAKTKRAVAGVAVCTPKSKKRAIPAVIGRCGRAVRRRIDIKSRRRIRQAGVRYGRVSIPIGYSRTSTTREEHYDAPDKNRPGGRSAKREWRAAKYRPHEPSYEHAPRRPRSSGRKSLSTVGRVPVRPRPRSDSAWGPRFSRRVSSATSRADPSSPSSCSRAASPRRAPRPLCGSRRTTRRPDSARQRPTPSPRSRGRPRWA